MTWCPLPAWYVELVETHEAEMQRLFAERLDQTGMVLLAHAPALHGALVCAECGMTGEDSGRREQAPCDVRLWPMTAEDEARLERFWRERCGEPCLHDWPIRCRRDLGHDDGHLGLAGTELVAWPGTGNAVSAQTGPGMKCWCRRSRPIDASACRTDTDPAR